MKEEPEKVADETLQEIGDNLWKKFDSIVAKDDFEYGRLKGVQHNIYLKTDKPIR